MKKLLSRFILCLILLTNSSCSLQSLGLRFADTLIKRELDKHFDFTAAQEDKVDQLVDAWISDLKKEFLPLLVQKIRRLNEELQNDQVAKDSVFFKQRISDTRVFLLSSTTSIKKILPEFSQTLSTENWSHFEKRYSKRTEEIKNEKQQSRLARNLGFFIGKMDERQTQLIDAWVEADPFPQEIRLQNREFGFGKFKSEMGAFSSEGFQKAASLWLTDSSQFQTAQAQQFYIARGEKLAELFAELFVTLTPTQKAELESQLSTLALNIEQFANRK